MGGLAGKNHWDEIEDRRDEGLKVKAEEIHSTEVEETSGEWEGEKSHGEILELKETPKVWRQKKKKKPRCFKEHSGVLFSVSPEQ